MMRGGPAGLAASGRTSDIENAVRSVGASDSKHAIHRSSMKFASHITVSQVDVKSCAGCQR